MDTSTVTSDLLTPLAAPASCVSPSVDGSAALLQKSAKDARDGPGLAKVDSSIFPAESIWADASPLVRVLRAVARVPLQLFLRWLDPGSTPTNILCLMVRAVYGVDAFAPMFCRALGKASGTPDAAILYTWGPFAIHWLNRSGAGNLLVSRVRFFDDRITAALNDPTAPISQVVILAAGFDSSALRFSRPGVTFFEVDLPRVSARKQQLLRSCRLLLPATGTDVDSRQGVAADGPEAAHNLDNTRFISADLSHVPLSEALAPSTGFDPSQRTLWLAQGLLCYLPPVAVQSLFLSVRALSAPASRFAFDINNMFSIRSSWLPLNPTSELIKLLTDARGEPLRSCWDERPESVDAFARRCGFERTLLLGSRELLERHSPDSSSRNTVPRPWSADLLSCVEFRAT